MTTFDHSTDPNLIAALKGVLSDLDLPPKTDEEIADAIRRTLSDECDAEE